MSRTVKRGGKSVRRVAAAQGKAKQVRAAKARTGSAFGAFMAWQPFTEGQLQKCALFAILAGAAALTWGVAQYAGLPQLAQVQFATAAADAGFKVRRVEVRGVKHLNELKVYERALAQRDRAMPLVDVEALRGNLMELSWVEDARVSRQLPDTLVIDIVERTPHAVLQKPDRLVLIDDQGHELEPISTERAKGKLVISGPGAGQQVAALGSLLGAAPAMMPQVREAEWVGNRRWNLTFKTGQVLALPQGEQIAAGALMQFARLDGVNRLLGGKVAAFDMRSPDRMYLRVPGRTDAIESAPATAKVAAKSADKPVAPKPAAKKEID